MNNAENIVAWYSDLHPNGRTYAAEPHPWHELGLDLDAAGMREHWHPLCSFNVVTQVMELQHTLNEVLDFIERAPVTSGVCCCGDDMTNHADPMICGHSPTDQWGWSAYNISRASRKVLASTGFSKDQQPTAVVRAKASRAI